MPDRNGPRTPDSRDGAGVRFGSSETAGGPACSGKEGSRARQRAGRRRPDPGIADCRRLPEVLGKPGCVLGRMPAEPVSGEAPGRRRRPLREAGRKTVQTVLERSRDRSKGKRVPVFEIGENPTGRTTRRSSTGRPGPSRATAATTGWGCAW